jgi:hypothetical protein
VVATTGPGTAERMIFATATSNVIGVGKYFPHPTKNSIDFTRAAPREINASLNYS